MSKFWITLKEAIESLQGPTVLAGPDIENNTAPEEFRAQAVPKPSGTYSKVPAKWAWLLKVNGLPRLVQEALKEYGVIEGGGTVNNPRIIAWADEVHKLFPTTYTSWASDWYNKDSIPWCGLFMALVAARSANGLKNRGPVSSYLTALAWAAFGKAVDFRNLNNIYCGDIGVFTREGGGHVFVIIGVSTDGKYIVGIGGNQDNAVNIKLMPVSRLYAVRRVPYNVRPLGARHFRINPSGIPISTVEQ